MILPFAMYNTSRFDRFVLLNTNAGYAFFWANHPVYGTRFEGILPPEYGTYQDLIPEEIRHLDEPALEQALLERGLQFVTDDPGRYVLLSLSRIPVYFKFWPSADSSLISNISRVGSFALFLPLMLGGLVYSLVNRDLRRRTFGEASLLLLFIFVYTGIHLDDFGYVQQNRHEMEVLFTLLAERYERRSLMITSNLVFSEWDRIFLDPLTTQSATDRVVHHSVIVEFGQAMTSFRAEEAHARQHRSAAATKDDHS